MVRQPPRLIGVRHVIISVVLGVLLSLATIPLGVIAPWTADIRAMPPAPARPVYWVDDDHAVLFSSRRRLGLDIPGYSFARVERLSGPQPQNHFGDIPDVSQDPRPDWSVAPYRGANEVVLARASGLPWLAAYGHRRRSVSSAQWSSRDGLISLDAIGSRESVPFKPLWLGLLGNALFWAGVVVPGVALVSWGRRLVRRQKSRCVTCGYSLLGITGPCPECGTVDMKLTKPMT